MKSSLSAMFFRFNEFCLLQRKTRPVVDDFMLKLMQFPCFAIDLHQVGMQTAILLTDAIGKLIKRSRITGDTVDRELFLSSAEVAWNDLQAPLDKTSRLFEPGNDSKNTH